MRYFVIVLFFVFSNNTLTAQVDKTTTDDIAIETERPNLILKWSPSPLVSFTAPSMQFSVEYPIGKKTQRFYLEHDVGLVFAHPNYSEENNNGFRFGTRFKCYFRDMNETFDNFYVSIMGRFIQRNEKGSQFFERAGGAYQQRFDFTRQNKYASGYLELGYFGRFGEESRLTFEIFAGGGLLYITDTYKNVPDDAAPIVGRGLFERRRNQALPSIIMVFKFGYILK